MAEILLKFNDKKSKEFIKRAEKVPRAIDMYLDGVSSFAQKRAKRNGYAPHKTGALKQNLVAERNIFGFSKHVTTVFVRGKIRYADYQEEGTRFFKGKFFLRKTQQDIIDEKIREKQLKRVYKKLGL